MTIQKYLVELENIEEDKQDSFIHEQFSDSYWGQYQQKVWNLFEHPASSTGAKIIGMFSIFCVFVSTLILTLDTLPLFQVKSSAA